MIYIFETCFHLKKSANLFTVSYKYLEQFLNKTKKSKNTIQFFFKSPAELFECYFNVYLDFQQCVCDLDLFFYQCL